MPPAARLSGALRLLLAVLVGGYLVGISAAAKQPNIVVFFGDVSIYASRLL